MRPWRYESSWEQDAQPGRAHQPVQRRAGGHRRLLQAWPEDAALPEQQPRLQLHRATRGTSGSNTFVNLVVWGSTRALAVRRRPTDDAIGLPRATASQRPQRPPPRLRDEAPFAGVALYEPGSGEQPCSGRPADAFDYRLLPRWGRARDRCRGIGAGEFLPSFCKDNEFVDGGRQSTHEDSLQDRCEDERRRSTYAHIERNFVVAVDVADCVKTIHLAAHW